MEQEIQEQEQVPEQYSSNLSMNSAREKSAGSASARSTNSGSSGASSLIIQENVVAPESRRESADLLRRTSILSAASKAALEFDQPEPERNNTFGSQAWNASLAKLDYVPVENEEPIVLDSPAPEQLDETFASTNDIQEGLITNLESEFAQLLNQENHQSLAAIDDFEFQSIEIGQTPGLITPTPEKSEETTIEKVEAVDFLQSRRSTIISQASSKLFKSGNSFVSDLSEIKVQKQELIEKIRTALDTKDRLKTQNAILQHKLAEFYKKKKQNEDANKDPSSVEAEETTVNQNQSTAEMQANYNKLLKTFTEISTEFNSMNNLNQTAVEELKGKVSVKMDELTAKQNEFTKLKLSTAAQSENTRTGKHIPHSVVDQLEQNDSKKSNELFEIQLEHLKLRNKLRRQEQSLKQKEELAEGLHLIDFEQLKIENQTYGEKIEERNEELARLKGKLNNVVQVLTHIKEKLQYKQSEASELKAELSVLDSQVRDYRDKLPSQKHQLLSLKNKITDMREKAGLTGNETLLKDFELKFNSRDRLRTRAEALELEYQAIVKEMTSLRNKIQKEQALVK